jgi:hypothetical protein
MWSSHAPSSISDEARLNVTEMPVATRKGETITWHAFTPDEAKEMGLDINEHRALSTLGAVLEHRSVEEVAERSGFSTSDLIAEAEAWAAFDNNTDHE